MDIEGLRKAIQDRIKYLDEVLTGDYALTADSSDWLDAEAEWLEKIYLEYFA